MSENQLESISEIVAEMRDHERGSAKEAFYTPKSWRRLCDRLEAAGKHQFREATKMMGNASAMRDALEAIRAQLKETGIPWCASIVKKIDSALTTPLRNCDRFMSNGDAFAAWNERPGPCDTIGWGDWLFSSDPCAAAQAQKEVGDE